MNHHTTAAIIVALLCGCNASVGGAEDESGSQGLTPDGTSTPGQVPAMPAATGAGPSSGATDANSPGQPGAADPANGAGLGTPAQLPTNQPDAQDPVPSAPGPEMAPAPMPTPVPNPEMSEDAPVDEQVTDETEQQVDDDQLTDGSGGMGSAPADTDTTSTDDTMDPDGRPAQTSQTCDSGPLDLPVDGCAPEFEESGDFYADCVARINQLRWECQCLPPLERWVEAESCADAQAEYDFEVNQAHAGISAGICEPGGGSQNECPDYNERFDVVGYCLQQMWDEGPGEDFQVHGHYINMSSTTVNKVACGRFETPEGNIWSVQNFSR